MSDRAAMLGSMTYARSILIPKGSAGTFHCVSRCVRRAYLCGEDRLTGRSFEHRRQWVEDRIHELAGIFGVAIWGYAVMSNHLHVVVQILPEAVARWSNSEIVERWMRLYPRQDLSPEVRAEVLVGNAERIKVLRERLSSLSWFMRCLVEPIARAANKEDVCKGRFWEGRFKAQSLLDDIAVLAAMAYVDLNPVRAKICDTLEASIHTSARERLTGIEQQPGAADRPLAPIAGIRGMCVLQMTQAEYLSLVDYTGRQIRADKRGTIESQPAAALARLGCRPETWTRQVLAVKSDFSRAMGAVECLIAKASEMGQRWLRGIATARWLATQ
jgi:REP element-mobilizing transposase RayT